MDKCSIRLSNGQCPDGECLPEHNQKCCIDCNYISCPYRCDQSKEIKNIKEEINA